MHNYLETLRRAVPFLDRGKGGLPRGEVLALKPVRNREVEWEKKADEDAPGVTLTVLRREDKMGRWLSRVFQIPASRTIELDEINAEIWTRCDGQHSVAQIVKFVCETYKMNRRQGEVGVITAMKMLAQRRLIGFPQGAKSATQTEGKGTGHVHPRSVRQRAQTKRRRRH